MYQSTGRPLDIFEASWVDRRIALIPEVGVTVLRGPRWSGTRLVASRWAEAQRIGGRRVREALDLPPADADVVIADLTTRPVLGADDQERIRALIRACADGRLRALLILARSDITDLVDGIDGGVVPTIVTVSQLRLSDEELSQLLPSASRAVLPTPKPSAS